MRFQRPREQLLVGHALSPVGSKEDFNHWGLIFLSFVASEKSWASSQKSTHPVAHVVLPHVPISLLIEGISATVSFDSMHPLYQEGWRVSDGVCVNLA
jgi:hypothetical protein